MQKDRPSLSFLLVPAAMLALISVSCSRDTEEATPDTSTAAVSDSSEPVILPEMTGQPGTEPGSEVVSASESQYIAEALAQGMGHIELAQSVSRRNQSKAVDALAGEVIAAHNEMNAELALVAAKTRAVVPTDASAEMRELISRLEFLDGVNLDAAYLAAMLDQYPELIRLHQSTSTTATNMRLKQIAVRAQSRFEANLKKVRAAYTEVAGVAPPRSPEPGSPPPAQATPE